MTDAEGSRVVPRGFMVLVGSFVALAPLSTDFYLPVLPAIADDLDASASQTQLMITAVLLGLALGQLVGGPLSDQRGRRGTLLLGLLGFVVTSALSAAAPTIGALVAIRFVSGLAAALAFVVARAMVADVFPGVAAARAYALLGSITGIAPVVAPIAGGLLALVMDWRGIFLVLAAIGIVIAALAWFRVPETMPPHARQQVGVSHGLRDLGACLRSRPFMTYVACTAMGGGVLFTYISSSPFVLQGSYGLTPTMYSAVFAMNSVGIFAVALIGRRLVTTHGPARMLWGGQVIAVTGSAIVLAGLLTDLLPVILVGLLVSISSIGLVFANSLALGIRVSPVRAGSASALLGISGFLVGGLLAPLGGLGGAAMGVLMLAFAAGGLVLHRMLRVPTLEVTGP